jgi:hypothetical protein
MNENEILDSELNSAFVAPSRLFRGNALAPYTEGSRLLLVQIRSDEDTAVFFVWAFVFLHTQLAKDKKETIRLCWDKELFRERLMEWICDFSERDRQTATDLVSDILEEAGRGQVDVIPTPSANPRGNS